MNAVEAQAYLAHVHRMEAHSPGGIGQDVIILIKPRAQRDYDRWQW